jgi:hypothetical protein
MSAGAATRGPDREVRVEEDGDTLPQVADDAARPSESRLTSGRIAIQPSAVVAHVGDTLALIETTHPLAQEQP